MMSFVVICIQHVAFTMHHESSFIRPFVPNITDRPQPIHLTGMLSTFSKAKLGLPGSALPA